MAETQGYTPRMATAEGLGPTLTTRESSEELATQWRLLTRATTFVAVLTSPVAFLWFDRHVGWPWYWSVLAAAGLIIAFRGVVDLGLRRFIPWPSLFGIEDHRLKEQDVVARRRSWFWARLVRSVVFVALFVTAVFLVQLALGKDVTWLGTGDALWHGFWRALFSRTFWTQAIFVFFLFISNFLIFLGPLMLLGISQIRGYEPGDAQWGVRLEDVRGQAEAKEEVRRVVSLWQSGEAFESAGGRRERGLLFVGAPGTGKTMLAKAIATGFNSPFVSIPGSGFAQAFLGIDALIVRWLAWKARRLAQKWGGQCIVFIDEIDAVCTRRQAIGTGYAPHGQPNRRDIFDLYLGKVAHDPDLDQPRKRDELARITNGYSPAMIDQACSLALTYAHADDRERFNRLDILEAMTTVETGVAISQPYPKHEERATAIHEAGHAVCGHLFEEHTLATRLSIRKRG